MAAGKIGKYFSIPVEDPLGMEEEVRALRKDFERRFKIYHMGVVVPLNEEGCKELALGTEMYAVVGKLITGN